MKQSMAAIFPLRLYSCFRFLGDSILRTTQILSGFASFPHWGTMKLRNFLEVMLKAQLLGFNFTLHLFSILNALLRYASCWLASLLFTSMSSMYTSIFRPNLLREYLVHHLLVGGSCIFQVKGCHPIVVESSIGYEGSVILI